MHRSLPESEALADPELSRLRDPGPEPAFPEPASTDDESSGPAVHARPDLIERIDEDAIRVLKRLTRAGHTAYLVGGGVRDLLLGRTPKDFDIATSAKPNEVRNLFRNCRVIGRRFRLAHILFGGGKIIEVATFRRDPTSDPEDDADTGGDEGNESARLEPSLRKPRSDDADLLIRHDNVFGDPHEDAVRRDFTINGLFFDLERAEVIDYVGGFEDIEARVVQTIGLPDVRFREDPVRILRAIKFSARLDMGLAPDLYDAMVDLRGDLRRSAAPRLVEEILRLLRGGAAHRSMWLLWDTGILSEVAPELAAFLDDDPPDAAAFWGRLAAIDRRVKEGRTPTDPVLLASFFYGPILEAMDGARDPGQAFEETAERLTRRLLIPRRMKDRMRLVLLSQRRLRGPKWRAVAHRDFFAEAATFLGIDFESQGLEPPTWAIAPPQSAEAPRHTRSGRPDPRRRYDHKP